MNSPELAAAPPPGNDQSRPPEQGRRL